MNDDDVLREVRTARDEYCRQFEYDLAAIARDLREQERAGDGGVVRLTPARTGAGDPPRRRGAA